MLQPLQLTGSFADLRGRCQRASQPPLVSRCLPRCYGCPAGLAAGRCMWACEAAHTNAMKSACQARHALLATTPLLAHCNATLHRCRACCTPPGQLAGPTGRPNIPAVNLRLPDSTYTWPSRTVVGSATFFSAEALTAKLQGLLHLALRSCVAGLLSWGVAVLCMVTCCIVLGCELRLSSAW